MAPGNFMTSFLFQSEIFVQDAVSSRDEIKTEAGRLNPQWSLKNIQEKISHFQTFCVYVFLCAPNMPQTVSRQHSQES